jgi:hypothetical protein
MKVRSLEVAAKDWARISLELRVFSDPKAPEGSSISIEEQVRRTTVVSKKWIFRD